jgi:hypothetical protein
MKYIEDMNLSELADDLTTLPSCSVRPYVLDTIDRLRVLHEQTRWIPVSEQMPTIEDADERGNVLWWTLIGAGGAVIWEWDTPPEYHGKIVRTHWKRIDKPEGV